MLFFFYFVCIVFPGRFFFFSVVELDQYFFNDSRFGDLIRKALPSQGNKGMYYFLLGHTFFFLSAFKSLIDLQIVMF